MCEWLPMVNVQMCECANVQMCEWLPMVNVQMCKCANVRMVALG